MAYRPPGGGAGLSMFAHRATVANQVLVGVPGALDGGAMADGEILVCMGQTTRTENGPWIVHAGAWARPSWFAAGLNASGFLFEVGYGTQFGATRLICMAVPGLDVVGTNDLTIYLMDGRSLLSPPNIALLGWGSDVSGPGAIGASTATIVQGGEQLVSPSNGGVFKMRVRDLVVPATPWTLEIRLRLGQTARTSAWVYGMAHRNAVVSKGVSMWGFNTWSLKGGVGYWTQNAGLADTNDGTYALTEYARRYLDQYWFRLTDDGVNLTYYASIDGEYFEQVLQHARNTWYGGALGPTHAGYYLDPSSVACNVTLDHVRWL
jgi:hypothetical protein